MQKIKNVFYEHRFGLFFFLMLTFFGLVVLDPMRIIESQGVTYSFYCVDFSFGFCTKLLPGAVYSLLVGEYNEMAVTIYVKALIVISFVAISILFEKLIKNTRDENRKEVFFYLCFLTTIICFFFFTAGLVYLLDFHWIIATIAFLICISNKRLYVFIPVVIFSILLTHYVAIICYGAICLMIMFYKICTLEDRNEKRYLTIIFVVTCVIGFAFCVYMAFFETENINITYAQFKNVLESRGVVQTDYYLFAFFRENVESLFEDYYTAETEGLIENIDTNQSTIAVLIQTIIQQFRINMYLSDHKTRVPQVLIFVPGISFMIGSLIVRIKEDKLLVKLIKIAGILLLGLILVIGLLLSTDTLRWIGNALLTFTVFYIFVMYNGKKDAIEKSSVVSRLPDGVYYLYLVFCLLFTVI